MIYLWHTINNMSKSIFLFRIYALVCVAGVGICKLVIYFYSFLPTMGLLLILYSI